MRNRLRSARKITAGIALGVAIMAVVDGATTSPEVQRLAGVALIAAGLAGWGVRAAVRKVRSANQSTDSQTHNLLSRALNWRFRRG